MKFALGSLLALCVTTVTFAQDPSTAGIASSSPSLGSVVRRGEVASIQWAVTDQTVTSIDTIELLKGLATALDVILPNILANGSIPVSNLFYNWTVPADLAPDNNYALRFTGNNLGATYSPYFTIL